MMEKNKKNETQTNDYFECYICKKNFKKKNYLSQHMQTHKRKRECEFCGTLFTFPSSLKRHERTVHGAQTAGKVTQLQKKSKKKKYDSSTDTNSNSNNRVAFSCRHCQRQFETYPLLVNHIEQFHPLHQTGGRQELKSKQLFENIDENTDYINPTDRLRNEINQGGNNIDYDDMEDRNESSGFKHDKGSEINNLHKSDSTSALRNGVENKYIYPRQHERFDMLPFFANSRDEIMTYLRARAQQLGSIKWNLCVQIEMQRDDGNETAISSPYFRSLTYRFFHSDRMNDHDLNEAFQKMFAGLEKYQKEGSNWFVKRILKLEIHTVVYQPLTGSTYIPLPKTLLFSQSILNIQNIDNKCFLYCVLASLYPQQCLQPENPRHYEPYEHELVMSGIHYPIALSDISKFERKNDNISINVFGFEQETIIPLRLTSYTERLHHVNLLWLKNEYTSHYCLITDLNRFLSRTKTTHKKSHFCPYCLHGFIREDLLIKHKEYCSLHGPQKVILPSNEKDAILTFKEFEKTMKVPFVIYADFETINLPFHTCAPDPEYASTTPASKLEVCGFAYKVVCENPRYTKPTVTYRGPNSSFKLIESLLKEQNEIKEILSHIEPMPEHEGFIANAKQCCLCKKEFSLYDKTYKKIVTHHNHLTGEIIGTACNACNLNCKQSKFTCVMFHNLRNFDAHILCESLGQFKDYKLTCIPQTSERYISFSLGSLRFLDSFQFLPCSLESLVDNLKQDGADKFSHLSSEFNGDEIKLLMKKGIYPYDYMDSFDRFEEKELPPLTAFYSIIKRANISEEEYAHAQKVFNTFNMSCLGHYHDLYVKTDVLLLADVFESFRKVCLSQYELDPCQFYTSPGLSWASLLKMTGVELELLTDIDQILMIEAGTRGGLSQISNRYKKANNPFLADFDTSLPTSYLMYFDACNLYGWSMTKKLPMRDFKFLDNIENFDVMSVEENGDTGYILDVSLHYPPELHDLHNCLPLAPEQRVISNDELSPYAQKLLRKMHGLTEEDPLPARAQVKKLLATLGDKDHYILHYRNLQLYVKLGLKIKEVHRVLQFQQKAWMKPYIEFNTRMRKQAKSTFEKNFYKMMNCSVFGKTLQNERKHRNIELIHSEERLKKLTAKPTYMNTIIFNEDLVAVELLRSKVKLFKPIYCGMTILDLSKYLMYEFWYGYIKQKYGDTAQLQMTDTDSLLFYCQTTNIYEDMMQSIHLFDTSDYPEDHVLHSIHNKKVLGKMKDECNGQPISEFVGLRSKMYSFICNSKEEKRAKGVSKVTVKKDLKHAHYKSVLFDEKKEVSSMTSIRSHQHELFCENINKTGLSAFDDKRYLINSVESYAYYHYKINGARNVTSDISNGMPFNQRLQNTQSEPSVFQGQHRTTKEDQSFTLNGCQITRLRKSGVNNESDHSPVESSESLLVDPIQIEPLVFNDRVYTQLEDQSFELKGCKITPFNLCNQEHVSDNSAVELVMGASSKADPSDNKSFILGDFRITPYT